MGHTIFEANGKRYKLTVETDENADDPLDWDGNLAHFKCLGRNDFPTWNDEITQEEYSNAEHEITKEFIDAHRRHDYYDQVDMDAIRAEIVRIIQKHLEDDAKAKGDEVLCYPVYGISHSGVDIALHDFPEGGGWDNFLLGFVYYRKSEAKAMGAPWPQDRQRAEDDVETYAAYLRGEVYGYMLSTIDEDGDEIDQIDSCWGFVDNAANPKYGAVAGMAESLGDTIEGMSADELRAKLQEAMLA
jgi:hypothetical protein